MGVVRLYQELPSEEDVKVLEKAKRLFGKKKYYRSLKVLNKAAKSKRYPFHRMFGVQELILSGEVFDYFLGRLSKCMGDKRPESGLIALRKKSRIVTIDDIADIHETPPERREGEVEVRTGWHKNLMERVGKKKIGFYYHILARVEPDDLAVTRRRYELKISLPDGFHHFEELAHYGVEEMWRILLCDAFYRGTRKIGYLAVERLWNGGIKIQDYTPCKKYIEESLGDDQSQEPGNKYRKETITHPLTIKIPDIKLEFESDRYCKVGRIIKV